jgi:hypothetical protein
MEPLPEQPRSLFLDIPFNKRWDALKDVIQRLYVDEDRNLSEVMQYMKDQYQFDAV